MEEIQLFCLRAFTDSKNQYYWRFAFAKLAHVEGYTHQQIAEFLQFKNHSSSIFAVKRAHQLIDERNDDFVPAWNGLKIAWKSRLQTSVFASLDVLTDHIINYVCDEENYTKRFNYVRSLLIGVHGSTQQIERCLNDVPTMFEQRSNDA